MDRKRFLRLSSLGIIATLLPAQSVSALHSINQNLAYDPKNFPLAMAKAKLAKAHFFKKEFSMAEQLYLECINLAPASVRFYDNLQSVYNTQGKYLETIILYKNGLERNQQKIAFFDRLAKSLMRLETGNKKISDQYKNTYHSNSLLQDAKKLYLDALVIDPDKKYLKIGLKKVRKKIREGAADKDYRIDRVGKDKKNARRKNHKKRYEVFSTSQLEQKVHQINTAPRNPLLPNKERSLMLATINAEKKHIYRALVKRKRREKDFEAAANYASSLYNLDTSDSFSIEKLSRLYKKTKQFEAYLNLRKEYANNSQRAWAHIGLMKAINLAHKKGVASANLSEAIQTGNSLLSEWDLKDSLQIDVIDILAQTQLNRGNHTKAIELYKESLNQDEKRSSGQINKLLLGYAKAHFKIRDYHSCLDILLISLDKLQPEEGLFEEVQKAIRLRSNNDFNKRKRLTYLLARTYKKLNDRPRELAILNEILAENPNDKFALKRINN